ncbi:MAG: hypothetical protein AB7I27_17850 [Bacteriovoracaceae bacterium]
MKYFIHFFIWLLPSFVWSQTSYVAPTRLLQKKGHQLQISGDYFKTSKTLDKNGKGTTLPSGESFSRSQLELGGFYGATEQLQFGVGVRYRQNQSTYFNNSNQSIDATSSGVQSTFLSIMYGFRPQGQWNFTLEGLYRYVPYTNKVAPYDETELILGDEGNEYSFGLGGTYSFKNNSYLTAKGGYRKPGSDLSSEIYWQLEGAVVWRYVALIAGVDGVSTLSNDPYNNQTSTRPNYNVGNTYLYNSQNREWIAPYAGVNFALGKSWRLELRGSQVLSGKSTDLGTSFGLMLARRVEEKDILKSDKKFKTYDIEATITKVSPKKEFVVIDKGLADDVEKGLKLDFFEFDYVGGNILVAQGVVIQVKASSAIVKITQRFNDTKEIKEGLIARGTVK